MAPAIICWFVLGCSAHKHRLWQHSQQDVTLSSCIGQNYSCCFMKGELILWVEAWPYPSQASVATGSTCWWINARLQYLQCVSNDDIKWSKWCQNCLDELKSICFFYGDDKFENHANELYSCLTRCINILLIRCDVSQYHNQCVI